MVVLYGEYRNLTNTRKANKRDEKEWATMQGDTLYCTVYLPRHAGTRIGYHYELMRRFAQVHEMVLQYVPVHESVPAWDLLESHKTDILAINIIRDSIPKHLTGKIFISPQITSMGEVWVVLKDKHTRHLDLVHWLTLFKQSPGYTAFRSTFLPASKNRSPYDSLLRVYGRTLGWDWRLLRSVMYQESQYRMNARSASHAVGLMQIKESTAVDLKIKDLYNPEENIRGAVMYFAFLKRNMHLSHLSEEEEINFILAAYNAGMKRIQDSREKADREGKDPNVWSHVSEYTPRQTQEYVEMIWFRYLDWTNASEQILRD